MDALNPEKIEFIISIAREVGESSFDIIDEELAENSEPHSYSELALAARASDSRVEDLSANAAWQELKSAINNMNEEERNELVALMWLGRGTYSPSEWDNALEDAREAGNDHTAEYMMRTPMLPDYLSEGLSLITDDDEDLSV